MTPSSSTLSSLLGVSVCLFALGCGHDDSGTLYSSGVDRSKTAATLSDSDKHQFCRSLDQHVNVTIGFQEVARILCLPAALLAGGTRAGCEKLLDDCAANASSGITIQAQNTHEQECFDDLNSCEAQVSTLEACVNVNVSAVRSVLESVTCARYGDRTAADQASHVMDTAASCASSSRSCGDATAPYLL